MNIKDNFFILACFLSLLINASCQAHEKRTNSSFQHFIDSIYQKENIPGIIVGILNNEKKEYYTAGFADTEKKMLFDSTTLFEIGSITKTFTAYVLMSVLKDNGIDDSSSILEYLPDSVRNNTSLQKITFLSLMNHTSGLPRLPDNMDLTDPMQPYKNYSEAELYLYLKNCKTNPDGKSNYSNLGAGLAGVLAERISGKSYKELSDQYIFMPFKMRSSANSTAASNKSQGYFSKNKKTDYWDMSILTPAGGLQCTGAEMMTYLQNMAFPITDDSKKTIEKLITTTVRINQQISVGRGWHMLQLKGEPTIYWHNGGTYGFSTFCAFLNNKSKAVFVVINQFNKNEVSDAVGFQLIKKLMSEE